MMRDDAIVGRHVEPDDLPEGDRRRARLRRAAPRARRAARTTEGALLARSPSATSAMPATCSARYGTTARADATATSRSRCDPTLAHDTAGDDRRGACACTSRSTGRTSSEDPGDEAGPACDRGLIAKGRTINVTLIFSLAALRRGRRGLHRAGSSGSSPRRRPVHGRLGRELLRLAHRHRGRPAAGRDRRPRRAARASSRSPTPSSPTSTTSSVFSGPRWEYLGGKGATPQRVLWASTSTKNPAYPDMLYVEELIGPDTVNTMPEETIGPTRTTARSEPRLERGLDEARAGVSTSSRRRASTTTDVTDTLEREGVGGVRRRPSRSCSRPCTDEPRPRRAWLRDQRVRAGRGIRTRDASALARAAT